MTSTGVPGRCPRCGGVDRITIAPGFYECRSSRVKDVIPPQVSGNPSSGSVPVRGVCEHRYQEGGQPTTGASCNCGIFAVGVCQRCGVPRCGAHGTLAAGQWICARHLEEDKAAAEAERAESLVLLRPKALAMLDRQLCAIDGSLAKLRELTLATGIGSRRERGVSIGSKKQTGPRGEWDDVNCGPCTQLELVPYQGREITLVFADDGRTYALGLGEEARAPYGMGSVNRPLTRVPADLIHATADALRKTIQHTWSVEVLQAVADLPEPPEPAQGATQTPATASLASTSPSERESKRGWFGRPR